MITLAFGVGVGALSHGYRHHHRRMTPLCWFAVGFACLVLKEVFTNYHLLLLIPALIFILGAHYLNIRYMKRRATAA